jgi:hypothetical protein
MGNFTACLTLHSLPPTPSAVAATSGAGPARVILRRLRIITYLENGGPKPQPRTNLRGLRSSMIRRKTRSRSMRSSGSRSENSQRCNGSVFAKDCDVAGKAIEAVVEVPDFRTLFESTSREIVTKILNPWPTTNALTPSGHPQAGGTGHPGKCATSYTAGTGHPCAEEDSPRRAGASVVANVYSQSLAHVRE